MSNRDPKIEDDLTDIPASDEEFSLEEILAEYGGSLEQVLLRDTEPQAESVPEKSAGKAPSAAREPQRAAAPPADSPAPETGTASRQETGRTVPESAPQQEIPPEIPRPPRPISLEEEVPAP